MPRNCTRITCSALSGPGTDKTGNGQQGYSLTTDELQCIPPSMPRNYRINFVEVKCPTCGTVNSWPPFNAKVRNRSFCNRGCYRKRPMEPVGEKFRRSFTEAPSGCWEWTEGKEEHGYGRFCFNGCQKLAHRVSWSLHRGVLSDEDFVLHHCDNPGCVNPDHLFLGTQEDNMKDMAAKNRACKGMEKRNSKLSDSQVVEILKSTDRVCSIAKQFGVSYSIISEIRSRKRWKHVTVP